MVTSSGKSSRRRCAICAGLHARPQRRCWRRPRRRPFQQTVGPCTSRRRDDAREPVLHILSERRVRRQLRDFRTLRRTVGVPLRGGRQIRERATARCGIAPYLARDGRRRTPKLPRTLADPMPASTQQRELLTLGEREIPARERWSGRSQVCRRHPTSLPKPTRAHNARDPRLGHSGLRIQAPRNRRPELHPIRAPTDRWSARRAQWLAYAVLRCPSSRPCHRIPPSWVGVATTD